MQPPEKNTIYEIWAIHAAQNAVSLSEEAAILFEAKKLERAYYLAHMSTEEASKAILLAYLKPLKVPTSELRKIKALLRNHKKKIEFILELAKKDTLLKEIADYQNELTDHINNLKNNTMYVSYNKKQFSIPSEIIKEVDVNQYVTFGKAFSEYAELVCRAFSKI